MRAVSWRQVVAALLLALCTGIGGADGGAVALAQRPAAPRRAPLTEAERGMARVAWTYFQRNLQPATCLVNSVDGYPSTTMWDTASYLAALVAAHQLGVIERPLLEERLACLLATLQGLSLFRDELPNKAYHTKTGAKVDYTNAPGESGFSAIDLGRLLIWLHVVKERYPAFAERVDAVVGRWKFCPLLDRCGSLYGNAGPQGKGASVQEGRLGYEEYAAKGLQLWGFSTTRASQAEPFATVDIFGVPIPYDSRDPATHGAHNYVVTESYALDGMEFTWDLAADARSAEAEHTDGTAADFADRVYRAQAARHSRTGTLTARTEHQLEEAPYFVYDTIFSDGYAWNTITDAGVRTPKHAAVSVKAAVSMWVLWNTPYTTLLLAAVQGLNDPARGFYEGLYEDGRGPIGAVTANTNGVILEALLFKAQGKIVRPAKAAARGAWNALRAQDGPAVRQCLRPETQRAECGPAR